MADINTLHRSYPVFTDQKTNGTRCGMPVRVRVMPDRGMPDRGMPVPLGILSLFSLIYTQSGV